MSIDAGKPCGVPVSFDHSTASSSAGVDGKAPDREGDRDEHDEGAPRPSEADGGGAGGRSGSGAEQAVELPLVGRAVIEEPVERPGLVTQVRRGTASG